MRPLLLVSAPWALFNRPSIQIGALKAFVRQRHPDLAVRADHLHLRAAARIGFGEYQAVSERTWIAESVAAALLFPEQRPRIERLFLRESRPGSLVREIGLNRLVEGLEQVLERFVREVDWPGIGLAGFSASLCQMTSSLLLIRRIKSLHPELPVVVGGSAFSGECPETLVALFPEINHLVRGEGEAALAELADHYCRPGPRPDHPATSHCDGEAVSDLNRLPAPDFDEYFKVLQAMHPKQRFFPVLPVEASRGCWWQARKPLSQDKRDARLSGGCAFCNLNLQWRGYRAKAPDKVAGEIDGLTSRHQVLSVAFMDNLLPRRGAAALFANLARTGKNLRLFAEIRADTPAVLLQAMHRAGARELQVGVEALSTSLLRRLNKGVTALQNIEIMRHCEAMGLHHGANLLLHFPGSTEEEVRETLVNLERAAVYRPLKPVEFWLGLGSPAFFHPQAHGIRLTGSHPNWFALFPEALARRLRFMIQGYRGDRQLQRRLWAPVRARIQAWRRTYSELMGRNGAGPGDSGPILGYQDGREFLLLVQRRAGAPKILHRLPSASRQVYLFCRRSRSRKRIQAAFPGLPADKLDGFLRMMEGKGLMHSESERFLSLAVPMERGVEQLEQE